MAAAERAGPGAAVSHLPAGPAAAARRPGRPLCDGGPAMKRVLIVGSPGAGKSTFAQRLAERTGLPLVHLDELWTNSAPSGMRSSSPRASGRTVLGQGLETGRARAVAVAPLGRAGGGALDSRRQLLGHAAAAGVPGRHRILSSAAALAVPLAGLLARAAGALSPRRSSAEVALAGAAAGHLAVFPAGRVATGSTADGTGAAARRAAERPGD
ncbi:AAA family ATPase [Deinococcus murrayi]|uniref:AAA family ATPase n=1 Tax=Deinococcus murrayi TaxID=68910 RepID=UPI003CCC1ADE